jgi:3-hydroxybutyryl-CoA dehydrogenase
VTGGRTGPEGPDTVLARVGVVGCGLMGSGIAEISARAGLDVLVREVDADALAAGRHRLESSLQRGAERGKLTPEEAEAARSRLAYTTDLGDMADRQLVIEAVTESEPAKLDVFAALDKVVADESAILASNTSSIPIMRLGMATERPSQVVGLHFFSPVPVLKLVELVPSLLTSEATITAVTDFAEHVLDKRVIVSKDRAGFVVNALLIPYIISAIRMLESGFATEADIDSGMVLGCNHPMGPLALADFIGLDTTVAAARSLYEEFKEPLYAPPPLLSRMVEAGLLGRKTGRGFYPYEPAA